MNYIINPDQIVWVSPVESNVNEGFEISFKVKTTSGSLEFSIDNEQIISIDKLRSTFGKESEPEDLFIDWLVRALTYVLRKFTAGAYNEEKEILVKEIVKVTPQY